MERVKEGALLVGIVISILFFTMLTVAVFYYAQDVLPLAIRGALLLLSLLALYWCINYARKHHNARKLEAMKIKKQREELHLISDKRALLQNAISQGYNVKVTSASIEVSRPAMLPPDVVRVVESTLSQYGLAAPLPPGENSRMSLPRARSGAVPPPYAFSDELQNFTPSTAGIFLARDRERALIVPPRGICHAALTGPTGGGKSSILRMLLLQLVYIGMTVYYSDINYAPVKTNRETGEKIDWRPIARGLAAPPLLTAYDTRQFMEHLAMKELDERRKRERAGLPIGNPIYIAVEELPAVIGEQPDTMRFIAKLLREARQYEVFFIGAMQDALTKTLNTDSGVRANIRTGYYCGGDDTTARAILELQKGQKIEEEGLGKQGLVYLKAPSINALLARVPYADNSSIYALLGAPDEERARQEERVIESCVMPDLVFKEERQEERARQEERKEKGEIEQLIMTYVERGTTGIREIARLSGVSYNIIRPIYNSMLDSGKFSLKETSA